MIKIFRDIFGNKYEREILSKEEIQKIFDKLTYREIIAGAYKKFEYLQFDGVAAINVCNGKLTFSSEESSSGPIENDHYLELFRIGWIAEFDCDTEEDVVCEMECDNYTTQEIKENFEKNLSDIYDREYREYPQ